MIYTLLITTDINDSTSYIRYEGLEDTTLNTVLDAAKNYSWKVIARDRDGFEIASGDTAWMSVTIGEVSIEETSLPQAFALHPAYPNPFNPMTGIDFDLAESASVTLDVFNTRGQRVIRLLDAQLPAGRYHENWQAANMGTGVYFFRLQTDTGFHATQKVLLIK